MDKYSDSIGDFMVAMAMDEDLGNIKLLERVFTNIELDNLDEVIERTKLYTGKELDDILNINGETLLNLCCMQSSNANIIQYLLDLGCSMHIPNIYGMDAGIHLFSNKRIDRETAMEFLSIYHRQKEEHDLQQIIDIGNS
jgi:ankyrin repeat protein